MSALDQMNTIVDILLSLDENEDTETLQELISTVKTALDNPEIYGDVRTTLETIYSNFIHIKEINYGLVAVSLCEYLIPEKNDKQI